MFDDPPDDLSDHPDYPENHEYEGDDSSIERSRCTRCGVTLHDHPGERAQIMRDSLQ